MTSRAEIARILTQNPLGMADRIHALEIERNDLRTIVAAFVISLQRSQVEDERTRKALERAIKALGANPVQLVHRDE